MKWTEPGPAEASYYTYDADGNIELIKDEPGSSLTYFEHGSHGLVTRIHAIGSDAITFGYDGMLRRVRMSQGGVDTYFRHDGLNFIEIATSEGSLTKLTHGYTTVNGIASVVEVEVDGTRYYLHQDHRGTLHKITDSDGSTVWSGWCDAWGRELGSTGTNPSLFWYQGQAWYRLTAGPRTLHISPTRVCSACDAHFWERDPLQSGSLLQVIPELRELSALERAGLYAHARPVSSIDPSGALAIAGVQITTWGAGLGVQIDWLWVGLSVEALAVFDCCGNWGVLFCMATGIFVGFGVSIYAVALLTNAATICDLEGEATVSGGSVSIPGPGITVGVDSVIGPQESYVGWEFQVGWSASLTPAESHVALSVCTMLYQNNKPCKRKGVGRGLPPAPPADFKRQFNKALIRTQGYLRERDYRGVQPRNPTPVKRLMHDIPWDMSFQEAVERRSELFRLEDVAIGR